MKNSSMPAFGSYDTKVFSGRIFPAVDRVEDLAHSSARIATLLFRSTRVAVCGTITLW
jgi:hypothetical protein